MNIFHNWIYVLSKDEKIIYIKLLYKVIVQLIQEKDRDYFIFDKSENDLLDKIHAYFYGKDWWIADPISTKQVNYILFNDIKNKIII